MYIWPKRFQFTKICIKIQVWYANDMCAFEDKTKNNSPRKIFLGVSYAVPSTSADAFRHTSAYFHEWVVGKALPHPHTHPRGALADNYW